MCTYHNTSATRGIPTEYSEAEPSSEVKDGLRCHKFECIVVDNKLFITHWNEKCYATSPYMQLANS